MACDFTYALTHYPLICSGTKTHRIILDFSNITFGTSVKIYTTPFPLIGTAPCHTATPNSNGDWQWIWDMYLTNNGVYTLHVEEHGAFPVCVNLICALPTQSFPVHDYNADPFFLITVPVQPGCPSDGSIKAIINGGIPASGYYFELYLGNILQQAPAITYNNNHTFTGLGSGVYTVRCYKQYPPGNPNLGQKSTCYVSAQVTLVQDCRLKATDCDNPLITFVFDGAGLGSLIGKVIRTIFSDLEESCYTITETRDPINTILGSYYGPFDDCPSCAPCSALTSTITKTDDVCGANIGTATVTPSTGVPPYLYLWTPGGQTTQTAVGLGSGLYSVLITDINDCTGTNSIVLNNLPCLKNYIITPCDGSAPFVVLSPVTTPNPNPDSYVGNYFQGVFTFISGSTLSGCFNMMPSSQLGSLGVSLNVTYYSYNTCIECSGPAAWKLTRCDDPGVYHFTNSDMSSVENQVINDVILQGCDATTLPCYTLAEECWFVSSSDRIVHPVVVLSYGTIYPDCNCCHPCLGD